MINVQVGADNEIDCLVPLLDLFDVAEDLEFLLPAANAAGLGNAATVHIVDGVRHMAHMEKPQAVVAAIREALGA